MQRSDVFFALYKKTRALLGFKGALLYCKLIILHEHYLQIEQPKSRML